MLAIRCPQCGITNHEDDLSYPRCGHCHEDLVRCASCRHFRDRGCGHPQAYSYFTDDLEAAKTCRVFTSRHAVRAPRLLGHVPAPLWVTLLLLLIIVGLTGAAWFVDPAGRYFLGNPLRLETVVREQVNVGEPFVVTMRVTNLLNQTSPRLYIEVDESFLSAVEPGMPAPNPMRFSRDDRLVVEYEPLPARGMRIVMLPFTARQSGFVNFVARVYAPRNQLRHEVQTQIRVVQAPTVTPLRREVP